MLRKNKQKIPVYTMLNYNLRGFASFYWNLTINYKTIKKM